jgi:hypothetical protein
MVRAQRTLTTLASSGANMKGLLPTALMPPTVHNYHSSVANVSLGVAHLYVLLCAASTSARPNVEESTTLGWATPKKGRERWGTPRLW